MTGRLLFENERVRITDQRLSPGETLESTQMEYPTVRWQVDEGTILDDTGTTTIVIADKHVEFQEAGTWCKLHKNASTEKEFRQVWFEIKQPKPRRSEEETQRILSEAIYSTNVGTTLLLENKWCRVWDFCLDPGAGDPTVPHHHVLDYVFVYVAKGRLLGSTHDGKLGLFDSINEDGDVTYFDIPDGAERDVNFAHGGKNGYKDIPMREYLVELK